MIQCSSCYLQTRQTRGGRESLFLSSVAASHGGRHVLSLSLRNEESSQQQSFEFQLLQKSCLSLSIVHCMGVAEDAQRVVATTSRDRGSEIISSPAILLKMLEPLHKHSPEVALIINDVHKVCTMRLNCDI
jgi:hypothetical protein